jgi:predicted ABC-type ATPase
MPWLVMVAGPNGSGKSTLTDALRASPDVELPATYINADEIQKASGCDAATAQQSAKALREAALGSRRDFMYETVMSHPSKLAELQRAETLGYRITVHFVATDDPEINVQRVALRVADRGHDVPVDAIRQRYARTMALVPAMLVHAHEALLFDNSRRGEVGGLALQAHLVEDRLELLTDHPSGWIQVLAERMIQRAREKESMRSGARDANLPLQMARLDDGSTEGKIEVLGAHFVVQQDQQSNALVLHDRLLLPEGRNLVLGQTFRIAYREGAGAVFTARPAAPSPPASAPTPSSPPASAG